MEIKKAQKEQVKLKIALAGPSGSGKTWSALELAKGLGAKKILVLDTENGSAALYSDRTEFDTIQLPPPYKTEFYIEAIGEAIKGGYDVIILDSISHAWSGEGGLLQQKEAIDATGKGSSYTNWATITKKHEAFIAKILHSDIDIIATMRSKTAIVLDEKNRPKKVGMEAIQRDGVDFEFTIYFEINANHTCFWSKNRTSLFADSGPDGVPFLLTAETGKIIRAWQQSGKEILKPDVVATEKKELTLEQIKIYDEYYLALDVAEKDAIKKEFNILTKQDYYDKIPFESIKTQLNMKKEFLAKMAEEKK